VYVCSNDLCMTQYVSYLTSLTMSMTSTVINIDTFLVCLCVSTFRMTTFKWNRSVRTYLFLIDKYFSILFHSYLRHRSKSNIKTNGCHDRWISIVVRCRYVCSRFDRTIANSSTIDFHAYDISQLVIC
jgi:hypothetical protein